MDIDYKKTLQKGRLVFKSYFDERIESVISYSLLAGIIGGLTFALYSIREKSELEKLPIIALFAAIIFFAGYAIYTKLPERKLLRIETGLPKDKAFNTIILLLKSNKYWQTTLATEDYLIASPKSLGFTLGSQVTVLLFDNYILVNILGNYSKGIRWPYVHDYDWIKKKFEAATTDTTS